MLTRWIVHWWTTMRRMRSRPTWKTPCLSVKECFSLKKWNLGSSTFTSLRSQLSLCWRTSHSTIPGVLITGGEPRDSVGVKVEVFNIKTKKSCPIANLPGGVRLKHSQCGRLLCGGWESSTQRSCLMLNPLTRAFTPTSVSLREKREGHLCWDVEGENGPTLLMGGIHSRRSTELLSPDGSSSSANFTLTYDTE